MARESIGRHPLCACPERREFPYGIDYQPDCRYARIAHPRVVGVEELSQLLVDMRAGVAASPAGTVPS